MMQQRFARLAVIAAVGVLALSGCSWVQRADLTGDGTTPAGQQDRARDVSVDSRGQYVSFITPVALVPEDTNGTDDVYRRDVLNGFSELIPTADDIGAWSFQTGADAREYFFTSNLALTSDDTNTHSDVYVRNADDQSLERVSVGTSGEIAGSLGASLTNVSADGGMLLITVAKSDGDHFYLRNRTNSTTAALAVAADQAPVGMSDGGGFVLLLTNDNGASTVTIKTTFTPDVETLDCTVTSAAISGDGGYVVGDFLGGTGCPTGLARYQIGGGTYESVAAPAGPAPGVVGVDVTGTWVLWLQNDGSGQFFVTSFLTGRTQRVSDGGFPPVSAVVQNAVLSHDGSTVAMLANTPFPAAGPDGGANGVYARTTMNPVADAPSPSSLARGAHDVPVRVHLHDSFPLLGYHVDLGPGVHAVVGSAHGDGLGSTDMSMLVSVDADAETGVRNMTVLENHFSGGTLGFCLGCFNVT